MRTKKLFSLIAISALVLAACSSTAETTTTLAEETTTTAPAEMGTVVDVAVAAGDFTTLVAAIQAAGLVDTLNGAGPFTVFAPTDAAFEEALAALNMTAEELLADTETLTAILTYHVLPIEASAETVLGLDGQEVETVNGASVTITIVDGMVMVNDATVTQADVEASNGIIHVIDKVLLPPSN
jgi:uncharacterized surface protein with fasciclin (FAS1) repeats